MTDHNMPSILNGEVTIQQNSYSSVVLDIFRHTLKVTRREIISAPCEE